MKCLNCGQEFDGKFCTNCGTPAPAEEPAQPAVESAPVCSVCGEPVEGKFCTKCGTPVAQNTPAENVEPMQTEVLAQEQTPEQPQPFDYNQAPAEPQPYQYGEAPQQENNIPPAPNSTSFGQQFTNSKNTYQGQQFTNANASAPNGKKPMSGGKIAIIVVSIVLGVLLLFVGIPVTCCTCAIFNAANGVSSYVDDYGNSWSSLIDDLSSDIDSYIDEYSSSSSSKVSSVTTYRDPVSNCVFEESTEFDGWKVVDYDKMDYESAKLTVNIPSEYQGKPVVEIERFYVFDNDSSDKGYIKVVIPGSVKVIRESAFAFLQDINEVVIEEGVETIEWGAFSGDNDLKIMHLPKSLKNIDEECRIGFNCDDNYDHTSMKSSFTLYCPKGSEAEKYGKANNFKIVNE